VAVGEVLPTLTNLVIVAVVLSLIGLIVLVTSLVRRGLILIKYSYREVRLLIDTYPGELYDKVVLRKSLLFKGALLEGILSRVYSL